MATITSTSAQSDFTGSGVTSSPSGKSDSVETAEASSSKGGVIAGVVIGVGVVVAFGLVIAVKYWKPSGKLQERFESSRSF
jgi:hypothetical protein